MAWLWVFVGGGLGSTARYGLAQLLPPTSLAEGNFPWATLLANLLACLVLGIGLGLAGKEVLSRSFQIFLLTGFCGGFSTFSTFSAELLVLGEEGYPGVALLYLLASLVLGVLALWLALMATR